MKVLMFGWEFPPKIYGGLAVASYGITKGLSLQGDVETTFCLPKPCGEEENFLNIIGMNQVPIVWRNVDYDYLKSRLSNGMTPEQYYALRDHIYADFSYMNVNDLGCMEFAGGYPKNLHEEINNFSIIAGQVARQQEFDIILMGGHILCAIDRQTGRGDLERSRVSSGEHRHQLHIRVLANGTFDALAQISIAVNTDSDLHI